MPLNTRWSKIRNTLQFKLFLIFTILTLLISCILSTLYVFTEVHQARRSAVERLRLRAKYLADSIRLPLYAENCFMLQQLAEQAAKAPEIRSIVISNPKGKVLASVHIPALSTSTDTIIQLVEVQSNPLLYSIESSMAGGHDSGVSLLGTVRMERGTTDLSHDIRHVVILSTCLAIAFWFSVSLVCYLVLRRQTRSFNTLIAGIKSMRDGDLTYRIDVVSDDEPGMAARAVNNLADELVKRNEENRRLHEERLAIERQILNSHKLESLGIMAGGIAHDFNNLLQSILGNIELVSMKLLPDSVSQVYMTNAVNTVKRATHLTNLMLAYVSKGVISKKGLDLNELVRENSEILRTAASSAVSIELALSPDLLTIVADEAQIQQVVMNLITNAAESIREQPGIIKLTTGVKNYDENCLAKTLLDKKPDAGDFVFLEVSDNGCGMDAATLKRIFDPFFTTKFTGRGLGMSAVMGIIRTHDGALFVQSSPGEGTTFRVLFPAYKPTMIHHQPHPAVPPREKITKSKNLADSPVAELEKPLSGLALVADDEKSVLKICTKMVELWGLRVITACDGIEAVSAFAKNADEISVVLLDLTMPNMDGIAAMNEIYKIRGDARIILASGFNEDTLSENFTGQPPSGFIRKPYNMKTLKAELQRVLQDG